ncbi:putative reverse transcriptase domain-containing protein, partial [Tanacetum coccineum]
PVAASPTTESPGYIPESDPEEDDEEDPEEDPTDYPADRGDDRDDEELSDDDDDDDDDAEEEEHLAPTDLAVVAYSADQDPYLAYRPYVGIRHRDALPSPVHETEMPEICLPLRKRPCRTTPGPGYEVGESSAAGAARQVGPTTARADLYGFGDMLDAAPGRQTSRELGYGILDTWDDLEDDIIYSQLDDARHNRALLRARVNMLYRDRPFHRHTALLMEEEARVSRAAWAQSMDACDQAVITDLLKADYRRQRQLAETLKIVKSLKAQMTELQRPAKDPAEPELPEEAENGTKRKAHKNHEGKASHRDSPTSHHNSPTSHRPYYHHFGHRCPTSGHDRRGCHCVLQPRAMNRNGDDAIIGIRGQRRSSQLTQCLRGWETVFRISNCTVENQVKFPFLRTAENKRKIEDTPRNNQTQQPNKRQNTGRAYAAGNGDRRPYEGAKPRCPKCNFNHYGPCTPACTNCKKPGHLAKDCSHYRSNCPQWKNKNQGNGNGVARAYAVGVVGQNPDNNVVTAPTTLDHGYNVELADGRVIWVNTVLLGCTLNFLNHPFHVDLMPVEMGTYDVHNGHGLVDEKQAVIDCAKKIVRYSLESEILIFIETEVKINAGLGLNIIYVPRPRSILLQGCHLFLAHLRPSGDWDNRKKKQLHDVIDRQRFPKYFRGLVGLSTYQTSGISIDLVKVKTEATLRRSSLVMIWRGSFEGKSCYAQTEAGNARKTIRMRMWRFREMYHKTGKKLYWWTAIMKADIVQPMLATSFDRAWETDRDHDVRQHGLKRRPYPISHVRWNSKEVSELYMNSVKIKSRRNTHMCSKDRVRRISADDLKPEAYKVSHAKLGGDYYSTLYF